MSLERGFFFSNSVLTEWNYFNIMFRKYWKFGLVFFIIIIFRSKGYFAEFRQKTCENSMGLKLDKNILSFFGNFQQHSSTWYYSLAQMRPLFIVMNFIFSNFQMLTQIITQDINVYYKAIISYMNKVWIRFPCVY